MRIAYVAPYQGPELMKRRPVLKNLALAGNVKIEIVSELLRRAGHEVDLISQGEVVEREARFYPAFSEPKPFHPDVPVLYASSLPVRFVNGAWSSARTLSLFRRRHRAKPYDLMIIYNFKQPQVQCAEYAMRHGVPVVLEYEDDAFVDVGGKAEQGWRTRMYLNRITRVKESVSGCIGVSPHLLSKVSPAIPNMMLRGVVDEDILRAAAVPLAARPKRVAFSGTHYRSKGLEPLIAAWNMLDLPGWELHIAGRGELTASLEQKAASNKSIVFHGLLDRAANAKFLGEARIGINPHDVSETPGNVFAFKIVEYLAAGAHCITTPMGALEPELEAGTTYMPDNTPQTIAATVQRVIESRDYERLAAQAAQDTYGPAAISNALHDLVTRVGRQQGATGFPLKAEARLGT